VSPPRLNGEGELEFLCADDHQGAGPVVFFGGTSTCAQEGAPRDANTPEMERLTDDLMDPMLTCFEEFDGWVEYGVIEHRLREVAPAIFARHVAESGHVMLGPSRETASKNRFGRALRRLCSQGHLEVRMQSSTGAAWQHDRMISYWRRLPIHQGTDVQQSDSVLTWAHYCAAIGREDHWIDSDRVGLVGPAKEV
jgi:hypothetical protein